MTQYNGRNVGNQIGDLGIYDGPPIGSTQADERARARIIRASKQLASTINYLGLRP